jgi:hypothetical protein
MVLAHLVDGGGWKSSLFLVNGSSSAKVNYTLSFRGDKGQPVLFSFADGRRDNQISGTIAAGGIAVLETPGLDGDPLAVASATLSTTGTVSGFAVIREHQAGGPDREATVSLASAVQHGLAFPFDNTNGAVSSIALTIPCGSAGKIALTASAVDEMGAALGQSELTTTEGGHIAFLTTAQIPGSKEKRGTLRISASNPAVFISGVGLRYTANGALTNLPAVAWAPPATVRAPVRSYRGKRTR